MAAGKTASPHRVVCRAGNTLASYNGSTAVSYSANKCSIHFASLKGAHALCMIFNERERRTQRLWHEPRVENVKINILISFCGYIEKERMPSNVLEAAVKSSVFDS